MKNIETCFVIRGFIRTSTLIVGQGWRNPTVPTISILQLAEWWAHHARTKQTCKEILGDYHDLYLNTDACLLADVFENLASLCLKQYGLDPAPYYTSPGLFWNAVLKKTGVRLELLTDVDVHLFIEQGTRGGISMVSKRFAKANNPYVKDYDPNKPNNYISYLDANNLYCWAMGPCVNHFQRVILHGTLCCLTEKPILAKKEEAKRGLILEVDLE